MPQFFRCTETLQYQEYDRINRRLMNSDDNEIFKLTGCLSKCDKYKYSARQLNDIQYFRTEEPDFINTLLLRVYVASGEYELREQVPFVQGKLGTLFRKDTFQYLVYDWHDLVADVGGYLGLLIGQSVFGLYEIMTQWLKGLKIPKCPKKSLPK